MCTIAFAAVAGVTVSASASNPSPVSQPVRQREAIEAEEERIREQVRQLPADARAAFHREARRRMRDPDTYAVLNWFFLVGLHHFYLGRVARGLTDVVVVAAGVGGIIAGYVAAGATAIVAVLAAELYALFRSQLIVQDFNNRVQRRILQEQGHASADDPNHRGKR